MGITTPTTSPPRKRRRTGALVAAVLGAALVAALSPAGSAMARDGDNSGPGSGGDRARDRDGDRERIIRTGRCTNGATWKLKLHKDDGRIEAELEVDQNTAGQRWRVTLRNQGDVVFRGVRTTTARSGSFSLERHIADRAGRDTVTARAVSLGRTGSCSATASIV